MLKNAEVTGKITFSSRVKEYPTIFYEDHGLLFCKFCCHSLDLKSSTIKDHLQTKSHKNKRKVQETTAAPVLRQVTLTTVQKNQESRSKFVTGFVEMCLASNKPLKKFDKKTPWIKKINTQGGALSSADNLRTYYIPKVAEEVHGAVSVFLDECRKNNEKLSIIVDESTDQREKQILKLNILVRVADKTLLLESVFLYKPANDANVAAAVNDAIIVHQLRECVFFLITDNTAYCTKTYSDILNKACIPWFSTFCFRFTKSHVTVFRCSRKLRGSDVGLTF